MEQLARIMPKLKKFQDYIEDVKKSNFPINISGLTDPSKAHFIIEAFMQRTTLKSKLFESVIQLEVGKEYPLDKVVEGLINIGYERTVLNKPKKAFWSYSRMLFYDA